MKKRWSAGNPNFCHCFDTYQNFTYPLFVVFNCEQQSFEIASRQTLPNSTTYCQSQTDFICGLQLQTEASGVGEELKNYIN